MAKQLCSLEAPANAAGLSQNELFPKKKIKRGWDMEFQGLLIEETISVYYPSTEKMASGVFKIEQLQVEFPWILVFDLRISKGVTQFCRVSRGQSLFSQ